MQNHRQPKLLVPLTQPPKNKVGIESVKPQNLVDLEGSPSSKNYVIIPNIIQNPEVQQGSSLMQKNLGTPLQQKYDLLGGIRQRKCSIKLVLEILQKAWLIFARVSPPFLGILEQYTIINYYVTQKFAHSSIKDICFAAILFPPVGMGVLWGLNTCLIFIKNYQNRNKNQYLRVGLTRKEDIDHKRVLAVKDFEAYCTDCMSHFFACLLVLVIYPIIVTCFVTFIVIKSTFYALLQVLNILPYYIGFQDSILEKIKFPITQSLIAEYIARQHLFEHENYISRKNDQINISNQKSQLYEEYLEKNNYHSNNKLPIRQLLPKPKIYSTRPLKAAQILNSDKSFMQTLLNDPFVGNFLSLTQLIKAVFQSKKNKKFIGLPMLIIQYINNSQLSLWGDALNYLTFFVSLLGVINSSITMILTISKSETFPLLDFKMFVAENMEERGQDPLWLLQLNKEEHYQIYDIKSLKSVSFANKDFYRTLRGISVDISNDSEFFLQCKKGPDYPFQCLSNIIQTMDSQNEFHMSLSYNKEIKQKDIKILFSALNYRNFKNITLEANSLPQNVVQDSQSGTMEEMVIDLVSKSKCDNLNFQFNGNKMQFKNNHSLNFNPNLKSFKLGLKSNHIETLEFLQDLQFCKQLQTVHLNLGQNIGDYKIENALPLKPLFSLPLLKDININLSNNPIYFNTLDFAKNSQVESLTLNLTNSLQSDLNFCKSCHVLSEIKFLNLIITQEVYNIDGLKAFSDCNILQSLSLRVGNKIPNIDPITFINHLNLLNYLHLDFSNNNISDIEWLTLFKNLRSLKTLYLDFRNNQIQSIDSLNVIQYLKLLENCHINLCDNKIESIQVFQCFEKTQQLIILKLELENNKIEKIESIRYIKNMSLLKTLDLNFSHNKILEITPLNELQNLVKLKSLYLNFNFNTIISLESLQSIKLLEDLEICIIKLSNNQIEILEIFHYFSLLKVLNTISLEFGNNQISKIEQLPYLGYVRELRNLNLDFSKNQIVDIPDGLIRFPLKNIKSINLNFRQMKIIIQKDIDSLRFIIKITELSNCHICLSNNQIESIAVFKEIWQFEELISLRLDLGNNKIQSIESMSSLQYLLSLRTLQLEFNQNQIQDIGMYKDLSYLQQLEICHISLRDNQITQIDSLGSLSLNQGLTHLYLDLGINKFTEVYTLGTISSLVNLENIFLNFDGNRIDNINFMKEYGNLKSLNGFKFSIQDTLVQDLTPLIFMKHMNDLKVFNLGVHDQIYEDKDVFFNKRVSTK